MDRVAAAKEGAPGAMTGQYDGQYWSIDLPRRRGATLAERRSAAMAVVSGEPATVLTEIVRRRGRLELTS
jgi:hypothetical protein